MEKDEDIRIFLVVGQIPGWEKALCWKESIESTSSIILPTIQEALGIST